MRLTSCWLIGVITLFAQSSDRHTTVTPLADENIQDPCEYRLAPTPSEAVRAAWVIFDRGQDYLKWFEDRQVRAFATQHQLALVLVAQCRSREREDMIVEPKAGVGRALFTALDQFGLDRAPIIAMGRSGAGSLVARLAGYRPNRYLAGIAYAPGQYEPLGMNTIDLPPEALAQPQLIIANGGDNINGTERPYNYFRKYFDRGAPWTFVIQNRTPHCCLQNAQHLILDWLDAILTPDAAPQYGYLAVENSDVVDEWKRPVFNATATRVGLKGRPKPGELPAGRLPSEIFAQEWLTFCSRRKPVATWRP